jgi:hypothetical protein
VNVFFVFLRKVKRSTTKTSPSKITVGCAILVTCTFIADVQIYEQKESNAEAEP